MSERPPLLSALLLAAVVVRSKLLSEDEQCVVQLDVTLNPAPLLASLFMAAACLLVLPIGKAVVGVACCLLVASAASFAAMRMGLPRVRERLLAALGAAPEMADATELPSAEGLRRRLDKWEHDKFD